MRLRALPPALYIPSLRGLPPSVHAWLPLSPHNFVTVYIDGDVDKTNILIMKLLDAPLNLCMSRILKALLFY